MKTIAGRVIDDRGQFELADELGVYTYHLKKVLNDERKLIWVVDDSSWTSIFNAMLPVRIESEEARNKAAHIMGHIETDKPDALGRLVRYAADVIQTAKDLDEQI